MAIRDRHAGANRPPRDLEPSAPPLLDRRELSARRADKRRRLRRRRIVFATLTPLVLVTLYFGVSYANYMLKPTSETFSERSAEWVRDDVPFGNWIIDTAEHYTASAPRKGGPGLERLPSVGLSPVRPLVKRAKHVTYTPPPINPVFATPLPGVGVGTVRAHPSTAARRCSSRPTGRARSTPPSPLRPVDRPHPHRPRLLPRPLRATERGRPRSDDGSRRSAPPAARHLQRRLHARRHQ